MLAATPLTLPLPQPQPLVANSGQALNTNERSKVETMIKRCAHSRAATRGELPPSTLLLLLLPLATGNWQLAIERYNFSSTQSHTGRAVRDKALLQFEVLSSAQAYSCILLFFFSSVHFVFRAAPARRRHWHSRQRQRLLLAS